MAGMTIIKRFRGHILLISFMVAAVVASGTAVLFTRSEPKTQSDSNALVPLAARVDKIDGTVGIDRQFANQGPDRPYKTDQAYQADQQYQQENQASSQPDWKIPARNAPVSVGDRIYVGERSHLGVAFSGRNYARLNPNTELEVLSLAERRTQLALREGSGVFDVGALAPGELCEVGTPYGAVDFVRPGLYQVGIGDGNALVSVLSGLAQVVGLGGSGQCSRGQLLTLGGSGVDEAIVSQVAPNVCGSIVDDYYGYRYPDNYDGRYANYDTYLSDPYYYDPYRRSVSYQYCPVEEDIAGLSDLDTYGDWDDIDGYGHCWRPRVNAGWTPYQDGYWLNDYPLGLTWVSHESWGWAPYHYGRWAFVNRAWYWVPQEAIARPVYAPALCAFVPLPQYQQIGWCPLGPGDPYVPRYYDAAFRPQYIGSSVVVNRFVNVNRVVNYNVPGAVTVVPASALAGVIRPGVIIRGDQRLISQVRPVVDPFAVPGLRQAAVNSEPMRPRAQVPAIVAGRAFNRPVVASDAPSLPGVMAGSKLAKSMRVQTVPKDVTKRQLRISDTGQVVAARRPDGLPMQASGLNGRSGVKGGPGVNGGSLVQPGTAGQSAADRERQQHMQALAERAAQGDRSARREMRQLQQQQVNSQQQQAAQQAKAQRAAGQAEQNAQINSQREQRRLERQQAAAAQQQQQAQAAQQAEQRRQANKQAAQQDAARQEQLRQQRQAEKQAARQQQEVTRQQQVQQQRQAEKQAARQQQQQETMRQQQVQQQRQAEKQAARQQQQETMRQQQVQQQRQAEKQAARQQQQQEMLRQQQTQQQRQAERQAARQQQQQQDTMHQQQMQQQRQAARQQQQQQETVRQQQMQQQRQDERQAGRQKQQQQQEMMRQRQMQ